MNEIMIYIQWRIQDFPEEGCHPQKEEGSTNLLFYLAKVSGKLHENEENWSGGAFEICLCRSATEYIVCCIFSSELKHDSGLYFISNGTNWLSSSSSVPRSGAENLLLFCGFRLQVLIYFSRCCVCMCVLCVLQSQLTKTSWLNTGPCCSAIAIAWTISFIACCDDRQNVIRFFSLGVQIEVKKATPPPKKNQQE